MGTCISSEPLPDLVEVARVRRPHGVAGAVLVDVLTDVSGRLAAGAELELLAPPAAPRTVRVAHARRQRATALLTLEGVSDRDRAGELRGAILAIHRSRVPAAPDGTYYHFELLGCRCHDRRLGEIGRVRDLVESPAGLLLELERGEERHLVPFVEEFLDRVDIARREIVLRLPPGLIEECASGS